MGITINGPLGVFIGTFLEEIIAPIPSALVIMGSSFLLMQNAPISIVSFQNLFLNIVLPATMGLTLGFLSKIAEKISNFEQIVLIIIIIAAIGFVIYKKWEKRKISNLNNMSTFARNNFFKGSIFKF